MDNTFFILNGVSYDVDQSNCTDEAPEVVGKAERTFDNNLSSSKRDVKRNLLVTLPFLTRAEFAALKLDNPEGNFSTLSGDIVDGVPTTVEVTYPAIPFNKHNATFKRSPQLRLRFV